MLMSFLDKMQRKKFTQIKNKQAEQGIKKKKEK